MSDLYQVLLDFVTLFEEHQLPYAVMGGIAVRAHGVPRPTHDVDFTLVIERRRLGELFGAVRNAGYTVPIQYESGWVDQVGGMPVIKFQFYDKGHMIDIDVFLCERPYQRELMTRRRPQVVDGVTAWLVTPEDLILLKLIAKRPRDLGDVEDVFLVQGELDLAYMRRWADSLGVRDSLEAALTKADR